jgi:hypothetical protein
MSVAKRVVVVVGTDADGIGMNVFYEKLSVRRMISSNKVVYQIKTLRRTLRSFSTTNSLFQEKDIG